MRQTTLIFTFLTLALLRLTAQQVTPSLTVFREFQPATVHLTTGKQTHLPLANIFLKNSALLYKSGIKTMQANIKTIKQVDFKDRTYLRIDSLLAYQVDTIGKDALYCAQMIDFKAWKQLLSNNAQITSLDLNDLVSFSSIDLEDVQDIHFPLISIYYYRLNGTMVKVHERTLKRLLSKEKRLLMERTVGSKGFSWTDEQSLLQLLKMIQ